jgi:hypothetical protein
MPEGQPWLDRGETGMGRAVPLHGGAGSRPGQGQERSLPRDRGAGQAQSPPPALQFRRRNRPWECRAGSTTASLQSAPAPAPPGSRCAVGHGCPTPNWAIHPRAGPLRTRQSAGRSKPRPMTC